MADSTTPPPSTGGSGQLIMIMMLFLTLFIMFDNNLRLAVGNIAGIVLEPIIGFDGLYPVLTVMMAGFLMVTFSTGIRHFFIDWVKQAEKQQKMKDFNKIMREARMAGNQAEVNRLMKKQLEMSKDQMSSMMDTMKPMMFTMIFLIATFAFIGAYMINIPGATLSVPWANNVDMNQQYVCFFTNWILVYFLISISMAQVIQRILKWYSFGKKLKEPDEEPEIDVDEELAAEGEEYLEIEDGDSEENPEINEKEDDLEEEEIGDKEIKDGEEESGEEG